MLRVLRRRRGASEIQSPCGTPSDEHRPRGASPPLSSNLSGLQILKPKRYKEAGFGAGNTRENPNGIHFALLRKTGTHKIANETEKNLPEGSIGG